jgi:hypothetical protein
LLLAAGITMTSALASTVATRKANEGYNMPDDFRRARAEPVPERYFAVSQAVHGGEKFCRQHDFSGSVSLTTRASFQSSVFRISTGFRLRG